MRMGGVLESWPTTPHVHLTAELPHAPSSMFLCGVLRPMCTASAMYCLLQCIAFCHVLLYCLRVLASGGGDALISLWDLDDVVVTRTWSHMDHPVRSISLSHDGRLLAYSSEQVGEVHWLKIFVWRMGLCSKGLLCMPCML